MKPSECKTIADVLSMNATYKESGKYSILVQHDGAVILSEQAIGQPKTASIEIPRRAFRKLIDWYETDQSTEEK